IDAEPALGRSGELVSELETVVREQPFQERPRRQLMIALYRAGRQADALALYRETRRLFVDELGIEPSKSLQALEHAILRQDDSLEAAPAAEAAETHEAGLAPAARPRSRLLLGGTAALLVLCAAIAFPLALSSSSRQPPKPRPAKILESLDLPQPSCCGFGFDAAWGV